MENPRIVKPHSHERNDTSVQVAKIRTRCFYHLTQSSWKKIQALGLQEYYKSDETFKHFCGMVDGLAFLPTNLVQDGMEFLRENAPEAATEFIDYFSSTYVNGTFRRVQRPGEATFRLRRIPPLFPVEMWNVHDSTINNEPRTNNFCEGWNNSLRRTIGHDHPSIWRLIEHFRDDAAFVHSQLLQSARGEPPMKRQRKHARDLQVKLHNMCTRIAQEEISISEFLHGIGHCIRLSK